VHELARVEGKKLIEINLETRPSLSSLFEAETVEHIMLNIESAFRESFDPQQSILFIDEIQAAPHIFAKLRIFAEKLPQLPVIAAGSLLEFVLEDHVFSMPVGRIEYMYLEPFSFEEFLYTRGAHKLVDYIKQFRFKDTIPLFIHNELMNFVKEYIIIGGLPAAVKSWKDHQSLQQVSKVHHSLLATYRDDFPKYSKKIAPNRLDEVVMAVPRLLGHKFMYRKVNPDPEVSGTVIKQALNLLCSAKLCSLVRGSHANGIPLESELQENYRKVLLVDVGLCSTALGLSLDYIRSLEELDLHNKGGIAEQLVGQLLRTLTPFYVEPALYYWHREEAGSSAEIDYVMQHGHTVIPVEVKAGTTGTLKSLHFFMELRKRDIAVRVNSNVPFDSHVTVKGLKTDSTSYRLLSIPFYLVSEIHRLLDDK
jgi:predicted AAA+ superfamily ATPase